MEDTLSHYKGARETFLKVVAEFPQELRDRPLFGEWNLKDILAHIVGWESLSIEKVEAVKQGITSQWVSDVEEQNRKAVERCKGASWDEMYQKLVQSGEIMLSAYQSLPPYLWGKQAGPEPKFTPRHFLEKEAEHYEGHLKEIKARMS
jgi:hypothetical protein